MKNKIKEIRMEQGYTQVELAKKAGVSRSIISGLESGKRTVVKSNTMKKIADALDSTILYIFFNN
jgi:DNA-binding XRE family transcriptional regulator|nr:MAG TPA: Helix-turn-helix XRE-family like protein [Caudoviricetes sp.]